MNGRSNGLSASRYTALVDLEPQFADALLDALREEGVAAYASPAPGVRGPYMDIVLPNAPTDRVFVDAAATEAARGVLDARRADFAAPPTEIPAPLSDGRTPEQPAAPDADVDAAWRAIVAGYGRTGSDPVASWPVAEEVDDSPARSDEGEGPTTSRRILRRPPEPTTDESWGLESGPPEPAAEPEEPEEHYVPPPPAPLPRMELHTKFAWLGLLGGPIFLIVMATLDWRPFDGATFLAIAAFVAGFGTLVYRMKDPDPGSGGDDGAVV